MDPAERGAYYGVALFPLAAIVMVFASAAISLSDDVELGSLEAALALAGALYFAPRMLREG